MAPKKTKSVSLSDDTIMPEDELDGDTEPLTSPLITFRYICSECGYVAHELTGSQIELTHNYVYSYLVPMYAVPCNSCKASDSYVGRIMLATDRE